MIYSDPLFQYLLLELRKVQATVKPTFVPMDFPKDPLNRHYDDRRAWLAWQQEPADTTPIRRHLGRVLVQLGRAVAGDRSTQSGSPAAGR